MSNQLNQTKTLTVYDIVNLMVRGYDSVFIEDENETVLYYGTVKSFNLSPPDISNKQVESIQPAKRELTIRIKSQNN